MKLVAVYHKGRALAMISHLDVQRTLQRAFRRAGLPLLYSNGFNPHPQFSFPTPKYFTFHGLSLPFAFLSLLMGESPSKVMYSTHSDISRTVPDPTLPLI